MRYLFGYISVVILVTFTISCGGSNGKNKKPSGPAETPDAPDFCKTVQSSSNSILTQEGISDLITNICKNSSDIEKKMYAGSGTPKMIEIQTTNNVNNQTTFVHYQGGIKVTDVSPKLYFNMMKDQAKYSMDDDNSEITTAHGYQTDPDIKGYDVTKQTDSQINYSYHKTVDEGGENPADFIYDGIANFVTLEEDSLYVVTNKLDPSDTSGTVKDMYSVSIIVKDSNGSKVYNEMTQTADNAGQHDLSVERAEGFFQDDAKRAHKNALRYKQRH